MPGLLADDDEADLHSEPDYIINTSRSVYISGPHHVMHNLTEGLEGNLPNWEWYA